MERKQVEKSKKKLLWTFGLFLVSGIMMWIAALALGHTGISRSVCLTLAALFFVTLLRELYTGIDSPVLFLYDEAGITLCSENSFIGTVPWETVCAVEYETQGIGRGYGDYLVLHLRQTDFISVRLDTFTTRQKQQARTILHTKEITINLTKAESPTEICTALAHLHLMLEQAAQKQTSEILTVNRVPHARHITSGFTPTATPSAIASTKQMPH